MIRKLISRNLLLLVAFPFALAALAQTRTDDFPVAAVQVTEIVLSPRPDGGCAARWCGEVNSTDGGTQLAACTDEVELSTPGNGPRCIGLVNAGTLRVARALRFNVNPPAP